MGGTGNSKAEHRRRCAEPGKIREQLAVAQRRRDAAAGHAERQRISNEVKAVLRRVAEVLDIQGYARIDAFVRVRHEGEVEVIIIEVNSLPGMTPATCIFHQTALAGYTPYEFIDRILEFGKARQERTVPAT